MTKVTDFNPNGIPIALGAWSTGTTSLGSNADTLPGLSALNFVQRITANTSNTLLNPIVNFASGSNILLTLDAGPANSIPSNTIRIHSTSSGGGGTISAGSNSTNVREVSTAGASTTLWSPYDHAHAGVSEVTASSSNTMQRGTVNLRAGTGIALALTDTDGDGEFDTATIVNTVSASSGGGSGGLTQSYLGYNVIGGSTQAMTGQRAYSKQITAGSSGGTLLGIQAYIDQTAEAIMQLAFVLHADSGSDTIGDMLAIGWTGNIVLAHGTGGGISYPARWFGGPVVYTLTASTKYWIGVAYYAGTGNPRLYYDTSGSDRYYTGGITPYMSDAAYNTGAQTNTTNKHSIRASILA